MGISHATYHSTLLAILIVALSGAGCGGGTPAASDSDGDGLSDSNEAGIGTNPNNADSDGDGLTDGSEVNTHRTDPLASDSDGDGLVDGDEINTTLTNPNLGDTDNDRIWDGEEVAMFGTNPTMADSDADGMDDGEDPQPATSNAAIPAPEYAVFTDDALGGQRVQLTSTRFSENHVVYAPQGSPGAPYFIYQTYLADGALGGGTDGRFDETDLPNSAIAVMNIDGSRPRLLTDLDGNGMRANNGAIDATPEPSPDGQYLIFISNRHDTSSVQLRLYVMGIDGSNPVQLSFADGAPAATELDGDPEWGPDNRIVFKREAIDVTDRFSRVHTATIDTNTMTLSNVIERTNGTPGNFTFFPPGDYDPKTSPDGELIASYRVRSNPADPANPADFGDWDVWVGQYTDPNQPSAGSIAFIDADPNTANLFPRWDSTGTRLALWRTAPALLPDPIDILIFELDIQRSPFSVTLLNQTNITANAGWIESMPSWNTDPLQPDSIVYSAER